MGKNEFDLDDWDAESFAKSAATARQNVEDAAHFIVSAKKRADWPSHRPGVELVFYLSMVDYETKVLVHRLLISHEDRYVWEKYLGLHLYEALSRVPKAMSEAIREMDRPGTASKADSELHRQAAREFKEAIRPIRQDKTFMEALTLVRNSVAAHHVDKNTLTMDANITWVLTSAFQRRKGETPMTSQILEYSVRLASAIQDFAQNSLRNS